MAEDISSSKESFQSSSSISDLFERRSQWRYNVFLQGMLECRIWRGNVVISNISTGGLLLKASNANLVWESEAPCTIDVPQLGGPRPGRIISGWEGIVHMAFAPGSMPGSQLIFIAAHVGTLRLIEKAMSDHETFVSTVFSAIAGTNQIRAKDLPNTHACDLGKWYDMVAQGHIRSCPSFRAIAEPHILLHNYGKQALLFLQNGDIAHARSAAEKMRNLSQIIVSLLSKLRMEVSVSFESPAEHPSLHTPPPSGVS